MLRKDLIDLLLDRPMTVTQIARAVDAHPKDVVDDLQHLFKSLKHSEYSPAIEPAECRKCRFQFSVEKLTKPSKCPKCRGTWVTEPRISVHRQEG